MWEHWFVAKLPWRCSKYPAPFFLAQTLNLTPKKKVLSDGGGRRADRNWHGQSCLLHSHCSDRDDPWADAAGHTVCLELHLSTSTERPQMRTVFETLEQTLLAQLWPNLPSHNLRTPGTLAINRYSEAHNFARRTHCTAQMHQTLTLQILILPADNILATCKGLLDQTLSSVLFHEVFSYWENRWVRRLILLLFTRS